MGKILVGGILGGILLFAWGAVVHMFLTPDGQSIKPCPGREAVLATLQANVTEPGVYAFGTLEPGTAGTTMKEYDEKRIAGPHGLLVYQPAGMVEMGVKTFGVELGSNVLAALLVAFAVRGSAGGFAGRLAAAICFGAVTWLSISVSQWNWYEFSWEFVKVDLVDQVGGWFLAGLAIAGIVRPNSGS